MKTKLYWITLLSSAALIAEAKAGGQHGGGGGNFAAPAPAARASAAAPAFHSASRGNFGGGRFMAPGTRFSSSHAPMAFRQQQFGGDRSFARSRQFATGTANRRLDGTGTLNHRENRLTRTGNNSGNAAREHVFARRTASWHRDWDRRHDHWWNGHRCRFVNGSWFIYDIGFDPYDYWYPYDYYAYDSYPYEYDSGDYQGDGTDYYSQNAYDSGEQNADSTVAAAQQQLARQGYYRGEIDGVLGPETRRAIARYQSNHSLHVTGYLTKDTLHALGLPRVASN
jgi:hypothetical protein